MNVMREEFGSLDEKGVWILVPVPPAHKAIRNKWVYDIKHDAKGKFMRRKAQLVAKKFSQKAWVDYFEVFAPVCRYSTARLIISVSKYYGWNRVQLDVQNQFLNAPLDEETYVEQQPEEFIFRGKE